MWQRLACSGLVVAMVLLAQTSRMAAIPQAVTPGAATGVSFDQLTQTLIRNCASCHLERAGVPEASAVLALDGLIASEADAGNRQADWRRIYSRVIASRTMPPGEQGREMPEADRALVRTWIEAAVPTLAATRAAPTAMRRLTNYEYNRSIRDLFGFDFDLEGFIQRDNANEGFTNAAAVAFSTPERTRQYFAASEFVAQTVLGLNDVLSVRRRTWSARDVLAANPNRPFWEWLGRMLLDFRDGIRRGARARHAPRLRLTSTRDPRGARHDALHMEGQTRFAVRHDFQLTGTYSVQVMAAHRRSRERPALSLHIDGVAVPSFLELSPHTTDLMAYRLTMQVPRGTRDVRVSMSGRGAIRLASLEIAGPWLPEDGPEGKRPGRFALACTQPDVDSTTAWRDCAERAVHDLARRAFRSGSVDARILETLLTPFRRAVGAGAGFKPALAASLQAVLLDPRFLYRPEAERPGRLDLVDFELATRLSYFLWGSLPDDELRGLAATRSLAGSPGAIRHQVRRMIADARADALIDAFAGGWLGYRSIVSHIVDAKAVPAFDEELRHAMLAETRLYLGAFFRENWPIGDLLDSDVLFVNARLARHYGITGIEGAALRRIRSPSPQRGGLLTQGSILTVTSNSYRTSVVKRGFWVLDKVLCEPVGEPPALIPPLASSSESRLTLRQEMEQHRASPSCAACHRKIDPLGFSLENYDPSGAWRTTDNGNSIDPSGVLPGADGANAFRDFEELRALLKRDARVTSCVIRKLMTYALGRPPSGDDEPIIRQIESRTRPAGHRIQDVVAEIANSVPFTTRR